MSNPFVSLPDAQHFVLSNATVPAIAVTVATGPAVEGLASVDIVIANGRIDAVLPAGTASVELPKADLRQGMVWPCFADMHTHLDKGHIWPRRPNPDGTFMGALDNVGIDREANWTADDVRTRMDFSLRAAYAHGTHLIRTHLDSLAPQHRISFEVFSEVRDAWAGKVDLQAAALFPFDQINEEAF